MKRALSWIFFTLLLSRTESSLAYCGVTTCGALAGDQCATDTLGCTTDGVPLAWPLDSTVTVVCTDGCDEVTILALSGAVQSWQEALCDGAAPRISIVIADDVPQNQERDIVLVEVIEEGWPYGASAVGRTTLEFGSTSGTLLRASIALNAEHFVLGFDTAGDEVDAQAVLTHELGHALGLAHSSTLGATMQAEAEVGYIAELSTLHEDDEQGLCALYPAATPEPGAGGEGGGPSPSGQGGGGCSVAQPGAAVGAGWPAALLILFALRRRRVSSIPRPAG